VAIGSYPIFDKDADYRVKLTVEHREPEVAQAAVDALRAALPGGAVIRES